MIGRATVIVKQGISDKALYALFDKEKFGFHMTGHQGDGVYHFKGVSHNFPPDTDNTYEVVKQGKEYVFKLIKERRLKNESNRVRLHEDISELASCFVRPRHRGKDSNV